LTTRHQHVLVLSDREIAREGLKRLLRESGFEADCAPADDDLFGNGGTNKISGAWADEDDHLVIIDVTSASALIGLCRHLHSAAPRTHLVAVGDERDAVLIKAAFHAGVDGFCPRFITFSTLELMVRLIFLGEKIVPARFIDDIISGKDGDGFLDMNKLQLESGLSDRETHILRCIVDGDANKTIARKLGIAEATVKVHVKAILRKLNVLNRTQAAVWVINRVAHQMADSAIGSISAEAISHALRGTDGQSPVSE